MPRRNYRGPKRPRRPRPPEAPRTKDGQWYSNWHWRKVRRLALQRSPLCEDPLGRHARARELPPPATEVHHRQARREHPELQYDLDNLEAVCKPCHSTMTRLEAAAGPQSDADTPGRPRGR